MISHFFLARPVLTWVLAIALMLWGLISLYRMPVAQYPNVAPPVVRVTASYPGASAAVVESSVTQVLEQALKGLEGLLYFAATSSSSGGAELALTFAQGRDAEVAQLQVQNKINQISYRLPAPVQRAGISVTSQQDSFLMVAVFSDPSGRHNEADIADWLSGSVTDALSRVPGVGSVENFGASYAMRLWLQPDKLQRYGLMPGDVRAAVQAQNTEVPVGELGARPAAPGQQLNVPVSAMARLARPEQFGGIVLKTDASGALVTLADVARVELGSESYARTSRLNGQPASGLSINMAPGANALATAEAVKAKLAQLRGSFPPGVEVMYPEDASRFVKRSIFSVVKTLLEAVVLVVVVMYLFLRDWRSTLIPAVALPVVLLGTLAVLDTLGYSLNTLTLFGLVLAVGMLVDDAIVVVENAERVMAEQGLDARRATARSMTEINSALLGMTVVVAAVFLPMAFFPGTVGMIYRQFSVSLIAAMVLSVLVAVSLTPVLCAVVLKARPARPGAASTRRVSQLYQRGLAGAIRRPKRLLLTYLLLVVGLMWGYQRLPTGFVPVEDQGTVMVRYSLPAGATYTRTAQVVEHIEHYFLNEEKANVAGIYTVAGFSFSGAGQNAGIGFVPLKDWSVRAGAANTAQAIAARANAALGGLRDAQVFAMVLPPIDGLGSSDGFELWLQDATGEGYPALMAKASQVAAQANASPRIQYADSDGSDPGAQLNVAVDHHKAAVLGLAIDDINDTLGLAWGGEYVNDFVHRGRLKKVILQADAPARSAPEDVQRWFVRNNAGAMVPMAAFTDLQWSSGPRQLSRFNGMPAVQLGGAGVQGASSGDIMAELENIAAGAGVDHYEWSGLSFQEKLSSGQAPLLYLVSVLFIFLCLAALYESWAIPLSVLAVLPLGLLGAVLAANLFGLPRDVYFQVGVLTTVGLCAKNAILIVEFARSLLAAGQSPGRAAMQAASSRLRPILMTSLSFGAGILPLAFSRGPGAAAQQAIGVGVLGGVVSATLFTLLFVPLCFLVISSLTIKIRRKWWADKKADPVSRGGTPC